MGGLGGEGQGVQGDGVPVDDEGAGLFAALGALAVVRLDVTQPGCLEFRGACCGYDFYLSWLTCLMKSWSGGKVTLYLTAPQRQPPVMVLGFMRGGDGSV